MGLNNSKKLVSGGLDSFDDGVMGDSGDPMESLGNLMDVMLVFAAGLMVALVARYNVQLNSADIADTAQEIEASQLEVVDGGMSSDGTSYAEVGMVYRDEATGQLYVVAPEGVE
ncbi:MAG: DUF2149 domain-containing protein [Coriobacteriales bacterium]